jgi:hypothetical protein
MARGTLPPNAPAIDKKVTAVTAFFPVSSHKGMVPAMQRGSKKGKETAMYKIRRGVLGIAAVVAFATLSATAGFAATPSDAEKRAACSGDVMRFCFSMIGSMDAIEGCLRAHKPQLSGSCKALFIKYEGK